MCDNSMSHFSLLKNIYREFRTFFFIYIHYFFSEFNEFIKIKMHKIKFAEKVILFPNMINEKKNFKIVNKNYF